MAEVVLEVDGAADVAAARRLVARLIAEEADPDVVDNVRLAVSEVVSNALLHGRPPVTLHAHVTGDALRIEVADGHTGTGTPQHPSASATSGRGLAIVDTVVDRWGFESRHEGKAIWMEFDLVAVQDREGEGPELPVSLLGVPIDVYLRGQEHLESTLHELRVIATSDPEAFAQIDETTAMPLRAAMDTFRGSREAGRAEAMAAASAGEHLVDFEWRLTADAAVAARAWAAGVAELDDLARTGVLLTPPADPDVARFRRWLSDQIAAQLGGARPQPFPTEPPAP
jgi:anti-sigma regulatory factor (Ser/Thr protein kinase)